MKPIEKKLLKQFNQLSATGQDMLLSYAEFLLSGHAQADLIETPSQPLNIARPEEESVIAAIKRLTANYPMLDSRHLLDKTSTLMTQHVLQGREADIVIDELEILFLHHYENHKNSEGNS